MANYSCASRTNYFRVKDEPAFRAWAKHRGLEVAKGEAKHPGHFTLLPDQSGDGSFPTYDLEQDEEIDFIAELAEHLAADSVAVMLETGAEKLRYLIGYAVAVNAKGEQVHVTLDAIYPLAAHAFGLPEPTRAE